MPKVRRTSDVALLLERGRGHYARREWNDAFEALSSADGALPLAADDLSLLAWSAGLTARDEQMLSAQERLYQARLKSNEIPAAARAAFWLGFRLLARGEAGRASGWLTRAQRLADQAGPDGLEQGYLLLPRAQAHLSADESAAAYAAASRAAEIGERYGEPDLIAFARNLQGRALLRQGHSTPGLAMLDEAMVAVGSGALSPVVSGILYCSAIASCQRVYAIDRAREWTAALNAWCETQPQLGMFAGQCLVHRAELLQLGGSWPEAVEEARRAVKTCVREVERDAAGNAHYQQAEIHRLRGEFAAASAAYHRAGRSGVEPHPGLALLRLMEGDSAAAARASRRVTGATSDRLQRVRFLPAHVEIMLAIGDLDEARAASRELQETADTLHAEMLTAIAAQARGLVHLAEGEPHAALEPARRALKIWQRIGAPFLAARVRVLLARACSALGDTEAAQLEFGVAREVFEELGARPDLAAIPDNRPPDPATGARRGLSKRELEVLLLVATGKTNKVIARGLGLSEKTIDRHVSNIFTKLGVPSRAAATAYAYKHRLI